MGLFGLLRRDPHERKCYLLYAAAVAAARDPFLYAAIGVPDTLDGRFDLVGLHVFLVIRRLQSGGAAGSGDGPGRVRRHVRRHGPEPARDGGWRSVGREEGEGDVGGVSRPCRRLRRGAGRRRRGGPGGGAGPQRLARRRGRGRRRRGWPPSCVRRKPTWPARTWPPAGSRSCRRPRALEAGP